MRTRRGVRPSIPGQSRRATPYDPRTATLLSHPRHDASLSADALRWYATRLAAVSAITIDRQAKALAKHVALM